MISSGVDENCKIAPGCPGCPPAFFSLFWRKLFGLRTNRSEEGGQVAIVTVFHELVPQAFHLLAQAAHLLPVALDQGVLLRGMCQN